MHITVTHEDGTDTFPAESGRTIHEILQEHGINVQNYVVRYGDSVVSEKEVLEADDSETVALELIKIVSGG